MRTCREFEHRVAGKPLTDQFAKCTEGSALAGLSIEFDEVGRPFWRRRPANLKSDLGERGSRITSGVIARKTGTASYQGRANVRDAHKLIQSADSSTRGSRI